MLTVCVGPTTVAKIAQIFWLSLIADCKENNQKGWKMAWTRPALHLAQDNGKVMGLQESSSASCRAYWTGWENQSQKSDNREAQMNSGSISRTVFSVPGRSWGAVQGHQTKTHALAVVSAEARPASVAKRTELWITWRMGKNCLFYKRCLEKETILQFWERGFVILWASLSLCPWGKAHRHPNIAGLAGETFPPYTAASGNSRREET